eukprot:jgi/Psemu1/301940/fgenesh1_kg.52_\
MSTGVQGIYNIQYSIRILDGFVNAISAHAPAYPVRCSFGALTTESLGSLIFSNKLFGS